MVGKVNSRKKLVRKVFVVLIMILFIWGMGYLLDYLKYDNRNLVEQEVLVMQNNILKDELKKIKNLKIDDDNYIIGRVLVRSLYDFYDEIVVNLGSRDGIKVGDAVVNQDGLIGIVSDVLDNKSFVKLLTGDYNVSVIVNDTYGNLNREMVTLLDKYGTIKKGDLVYTSGYGNIKKGIYVGKVEDVFMDKDNLGQEVKVKLIDNKYLNYVAILRGSE